MIKRLFDIVFSLVMITLLMPLFLVFALLIVFDSRGGIFFQQVRVGKNGEHFGLLKFRTMRPNAESAGQLTIGSRDKRITRIGYFLRKYKLDELPQLWNVLVGDMSIVGPRPEVPRYVAMYNTTQRKVLEIRPGITDHASLQYFSESELLANAKDPERVYIEEIMPAKLKLNLLYMNERSFTSDMRIIFKTLRRMVQ